MGDISRLKNCGEIIIIPYHGTVKIKINLLVSGH